MRRYISKTGAAWSSLGRDRASAVSSCTLVLLCLAPLLLLPAPSVCAGDGPTASSPFVTAARLVRPAVVNIRCTRSVTDEGVGTGPLQEMFRRFFPEEEGKGGKFEMPSTGSGFVIDPDGYIMTNYHVIAEAEAVFVRFSGEQREYAGELVGADPNTDLALLKIDAGGRALPALEFGDSDALEVGDWAIAVGNPFGTLESTLTVGVISAKGRGDLVIGGMTPRYQDFIQTDASINFGNSGGPLVDVRGRVMGVNTAINKEGRGIGFAVPSILVQGIYRQLRDHGKVVRGYLGIMTEDAPAESGQPADDVQVGGARILSVVPDGPGQAAGLQPGDIVTSFGGTQVSSRRQLQFLIAGARPGQPVPVTVRRAGADLDLQVTPVPWQDEASDRGIAAEPWLGLEVAALDGADPRVMRLRQTLGITATDGVIALEVREDSPAMAAGIRPGDVLVSINGREIPDMAAYGQVRDLLLHSTDPVTFLVRTGSAENYVSVLPRPVGVEN